MSRKTRKLIWSVPLVAVLAIAGALAIFAASTPGGVFAHGAPGAVTDLALKVESQTEIKLSWKAPTTGGAVDSYRIDKSKDALTWTFLTDGAPGDKQYYSDTTVEEGELRYYRVFAVNSSGIGPVSEAEGAQTAGAVGPGPVTGLRAVPASGNDGRTQIVLTWNAPAKTGGSPIKEYRVFYAIPLNTDGTVNTDGTEDFDPLASIDVSPVPTAPVDQGLGSDNKIIGTGSDATTFTHKTLTHPNTNTGLSPNTIYRYRVVAVNEAGQVSATAPETRGATTKKVGDPGAPSGLTAVVSDSQTVQLYWYHPGDNGGATITQFRVHEKSGTQSWPDADAADTHGQVTGVTAPTETGGDAEINHTFSILTNGTAYQFRVYAAHNDTATSPISGRSNTVSATPVDPAVVPSAPNDTAAPTGDALSGTRDAKGVVTLTWNRPTTGTTGTILSYRIDVSDDGYKWNRLIESTSFTKGEYRYKDPKRGVGVTRHYRVFARNRHGFSSASEILEVPADPANAPGLVRDLTAMPDATDPTKIHLTWDAPSDDGGADLVGYCIDYAVTMSPSAGTGFDDQDLLTAPPNNASNCADTDPEDGGDADDATGGRVKIEVKVPETGDPNPPTSYTLEKLKAQDTVQFRVIANNLDVSEMRMYGAINAADTVFATTIKPARPNAPQDLTAEAARDSNLSGTSNRGVNLLWNAPSDAGMGVIIDGYHIQVSTDGGTTWTDVEEDTNEVLTYYTHDSEPMAGEVRMYRVAAIDDQATTDESVWSNEVTYPAQMHMPGKPTGVMATKDADMPASEIKVSWSAPANGVEVTGYIIERRYGDMMMDITGYSGTDGANRNHAFMNYKEWWETLNCDGMLQAANIAPADATDEQKGMYCKQFLATAPSMVPDTEANADKKISDETAMKVKDLFMKRYVTDDMGKTMTMFTGMMYTDMGLMESTEYTYRVRAIHGMTAGMWSDKAMAMTDRTNTAPTKVGTIAPVTVTAGEMSDAMDVSAYFTDADTGDTLTYTAVSDMEMYATADIPAGSSMLTITGVAAGMATITVTATDTADAYVMQTIMVTVEASDTTLTAPSDVVATVDDTDPGDIDIVLTWTPGKNADEGHVVLLFTSDFTSVPHADAATEDGTYTFMSVASGDYVAVVVSVKSRSNYMYGYDTVTVP